MTNFVGRKKKEKKNTEIPKSSTNCAVRSEYKKLRFSSHWNCAVSSGFIRTKALLLPPRRTTDGDVCIETCALPRSRPKSSSSRERGAGVVANRPFACRALALVGSANLLRLIPLLLACSRFRTKAVGNLNMEESSCLDEIGVELYHLLNFFFSRKSSSPLCS